MKFFKSSLSKKASLGIISVLLPILITFLLVYNQNRIFLKNRILDTLTVIAESYEGQVYQFLETAKKRAQDFSSDGFIRSQLQKILRGNTSAVTKLNKHLIKNKLVLDKTLSAIHIISLDGRVLASTKNTEIGMDLSNETFFTRGKGAVTILENQVKTGKLPELAISAPIFSKDTGRLIGVIVNYIQLSEVDELLSGEYVRGLGAISWGKGKGAWKTLEIYLVNRDKLMLTKSIFIADSVMKQVVNTLPVNLCLIESKEMAGFYKDYRGVEVVGSSMYIPSMKWILLIEIDSDEVIAPIKHILTCALITAGVVFGMIMLLFIAFLKKVVKPLHMISDAAEDLAAGDFEVSLPVKSHDEVGTLCETFNYMSGQIKLRTEALTRSEGRLSDAQRISRIGNWEWDINKNEVYQSYEANRIFGLVQEKGIFKFEEVLNSIHPDDKGYLKKSFEEALNERKPLDVDCRVLSRNKTLRFVNIKAKVLFDNAGRVIQMAGTVQDITERKQREEEINLLRTLIVEVSGARDLHDALVVTLERVCTATGWVYGEAWVPDTDDKFLTRDHSFYSTVERLERFSVLSGSFRFSPGEGLPGRAWSRKQPVWVPDVTVDPNYLRATIASEVGLKAGVAFPVLSDEDVVAVVAFYMFETREKDERLVTLVSSAMVQLGQVIKRKQTEELLYRSEERLRSILNNATAIIYVKDLNGKYLFINKQFEILFHIKNDEIKGKTDYDLFLEEMADAFRMNDKRVIDARAPLEFEEIAPQDGGLHTYISIKFPLFDSTGVVYAVCGISTDITERKKIEEEMRKSKESLANAQRMAHLGNWEWNVLKNEVYWSDESYRIFGFAPRSFAIRYETFLNSVHPDDREFVKKSVHEALYEKKPYNIDHRIILPNGLERIVHEQAEVIFDNTGRAIQMNGTVQDITMIRQAELEREKLREELYHAQSLEAVGKLAGGIAHDFNNILTAIIGYGNLIRMDIKEGDQMESHVKNILISAQKAADLIKGLLAFSRKQKSSPRPLNLNEIVRQTEGFLRRLIAENIKLDIVLTGQDCIVNADSNQIGQVLMNLTTNAKDAMPEGGTLTIKTELVQISNEFIKTHGFGKVGRYACISFSDTGAGMDKTIKERIFEPFFTTKEMGKGTGLGLAIVYGIIKQHNGYIIVESGPGKGTTFRIYLPIIKFRVEKIQSEELSEFKGIGGTEGILLAEDEAKVRSLIKEVLERYGYKVEEAVDGNDALNKFRKNRDRIQLLIFDIVMPGKNGKEAYDAIRKMRPDMKVIFLSGYSDEVIHKSELVKEGLTLISKPVLPVEILRKVREVLDA